jgi:hypothetical protein
MGRMRDLGTKGLPTQQSVARIPDARPTSALYHLPISAISGVLLVLIIVASCWWRVPNLDAFGISNDEGTHLMWAKLANEGYSLYDQTRAVQGPLFIGLIQLSFRLLGTHVASGRWLEIGLGLVTLLGIGLLARRLRGWVAAWTAAAALSVAPLFFQYSRIIRGDVATSAFLVLALLSGYAFREKGRRFWLALSGALLAANLLVKATSPLAFTLILLLVLQRRLNDASKKEHQVTAHARSEDRKARALAVPISYLPLSALFTDVLIYGLAIAIPIALCFVIYDPQGLFDAMVTFRLELRAASPWNPAANLAEIGAFLVRNAALVALAAYGWLSLFVAGTAGQLTKDPSQSGPPKARWKRGDAAVVSLWLAITFFTLMGHTPLFTHHLISLLLPLALLAGLAINDVVQNLIRWQSGAIRARAWAGIGLMLVGFYAASLPAWLAADQHVLGEVTGGREAEAIDLLRVVVPPGDFVISDNQMLPFMAGRLSPPPLGDIALVAIKSGRQTTERLINLSTEYQVEAVITWSHRLPWLPDYLNWADENYLIRRVWDDQHIIYFGRRVSEAQIPNYINAKIGSSIELVGYKVESKGGKTDTGPEVPGADQLLDVTLYWRANTGVTEDYTVFVQLLGPDGRLITQHDGQPLYGNLPTSNWSWGEIVPDHHLLSIPADLPHGRYQLIAGMYMLDTMERLPVQIAASRVTDDHALLTRLEIGDSGLEIQN